MARIPDDPFEPMFDRTISSVDDGATLILVGAAIEGVREPSEDRNHVARYDVASRRWEELPSPPSRGFRGWGVGDDVVLEPHFGGVGGRLDAVRLARR